MKLALFFTLALAVAAVGSFVSFPLAAALTAAAIFIGALSIPMRVERQPWFPLLAVAVIAAALLVAPSAFAQTTVDVGGIYGAWQPYLLAIVAPLAAAVIGILAELARRKFNLDIEARHREALQTALTNGAGVALNSLGNTLQGKTVDVKSPAVAAGVNYVLKSAPAAMAKFGLTPEAVAEKITAKLPQIANTTTAPAG